MQYINEDAITEAVNERLKGISCDNQIKEIHPQLNFYYNSFNIILGKQGSGKTTLFLKEMIRLSVVPSSFDRILLITNNGMMDMTFLKLKSLIKLPIHVANFEEGTEILKKYFQERDKNSSNHIIVLIEDGSFLLSKDDKQWGDWICRLRHLRMTLFINIHIWRTLNPVYKTQISCVFIFKGFSKEIFQHIFRQTSSDSTKEVGYYMYVTLTQDQILKIDNISGKMSIISK